jgi:CheY-like chemotaxis protein
MDGDELTKYIRNHMGAKSNVPIALTAHATLEEEKRCMENGMNDCYQRNHSFNVLLGLYNNL